MSTRYRTEKERKKERKKDVFYILQTLSLIEFFIFQRCSRMTFREAELNHVNMVPTLQVRACAVFGGGCRSLQYSHFISIRLFNFHDIS
jgi:hypothetical protein